MDMNELMKKKCEFFQDKKTLTHIRKFDGEFYNGIILEIHDDYIIVHDRIIGELIVYFQEIRKLEPYKKLGGRNEMR